MAIFSGISTGVIDVLASDTVALTVAAGERIVVTKADTIADTANSPLVSFFDSPDDTSAGGDKVTSVTVASNDSESVNGIVGQGYAAGRRIIAVGSATGVNLSITYTKYTGSSV